MRVLGTGRGARTSRGGAVMRGLLLVAAVMLVVCWNHSAAPAATGSLWSASSRALTSDRRAAQVGDVITILVVERSTASHQAAHETDKKLDAKGGPGGGILNLFPELSANAERSTSGSGSTTQSTSLVDRVSGVVIGVNAQGNLQIQAARRVRLNKDEVVLTVSGLVRPDDVSPDNTVLSTQVADCRIESSGHGPIGEKQRPGLISSLLRWLW